MQSRSVWGLGALSVAVLAAAGCHGTAVKSGSVNAGPENVGPTYRLAGVVLGKSGELKEITVHQGMIRDFEPAMNAVYKIGDAGTFNKLEPGDEITGRVIPSEDEVVNGLEDVAIASQPRAGTKDDALPPHRLLIGEEVPQIPMVDQDGQRIELGKYRGKALLITFIDSKCTDDCPIIMKRFERVNELLAGDGTAYAASHLISISIDPASDTPPVLRKYGLGYLDGKAAGFSHWEFADLTPANLERLATAFGVVYMEEHGDIDHTMQTALIGEHGRLVKIWGGDQWDPKVLAKAVESATANTGRA
jgi:protein SCO1